LNRKKEVTVVKSIRKIVSVLSCPVLSIT
jgi:hypothetical protein